MGMAVVLPVSARTVSTMFPATWTVTMATDTSANLKNGVWRKTPTLTCFCFAYGNLILVHMPGGSEKGSCHLFSFDVVVGGLHLVWATVAHIE
ncbi:hypothetical protein TNCV_3727111 [Trichonephila clavipes]|nr:hypothetical protein TNCV_3727111 [Trichonephila clavipes]